MSTPEVDVRSALIADPTFSALVTPGTGDPRIYAIQLEQASKFPAATIRRVAGASTLVHGQVTAGTSIARLSFRLYAEALSDCHKMRVALINVLRKFPIASINDGPTDIDSDRQPPVFCVVVDARLWYTDV